MWRILKFLFIGKWKIHEHKYEIHAEKLIINPDDNTKNNGSIYIMKCSECGHMKKHEFRPNLNLFSEREDKY